LVAKAPWNDDVVFEEVRNRVLPAMEKHGPVVAWIVDDTGFPKKGRHSVGVHVNTADKSANKTTVG
jgi:SRSO17 transposase